MKIEGFDVQVTIRANARRMILRCRPADGVVTVTTPPGVGEAEIRSMVVRNLDWLRENLGGQASWQPAFAPGERHWCLGRMVTLGVDAPAGEAAFQAWRDGQLRAVLQQQLETWMPRMGIPRERLRRVSLRSSNGRWGSCCASRGTLNFSRRLGSYEPALIELTVVHELCHFFQQNHSALFYALMTRHLPDWERRKARRTGLDVRPQPPIGQ